MKVKIAQSFPTLCNPMDCIVHEILQPRTLEVSLQEVFPTQGSNPGLLHCRQILFQLSHQGSSAVSYLLSFGLLALGKANSYVLNTLREP